MKNLILVFALFSYFSSTAQSTYNKNYLKRCVAATFDVNVGNVSSLEIISAESGDYLHSKLTKDGDPITIVASIARSGGGDITVGPGITIVCNGQNCAECDLVNLLPDPRDAYCVCNRVGTGDGPGTCNMSKGYSLSLM